MQVSKYQFSVLICELWVSRDFRQSTNETASSHFGSNFSSSQVRGSQFAYYKHPIKGFTAKKSVVFNDDEPRPAPILKDFAHLMIRKINEAYIEFIQCRSDALVEKSEYTLKSKLPQVKHLIRTLRCVIF